MNAFKTSMQQAKRQCKGGIKNEYQCCKNIRTDIEMMRDYLVMVLQTFTLKEKGDIGAIRSRQK
jgi:hypothetical protein